MALPATIRKGSTDKATVSQWQRILGISADGIFGTGTETSTKTWQKINGLTADGVVGPASWTKALVNVQSSSGPAQAVTFVAPKPAPTATATPTTDSTPTLRRGSQGAAVTRWQGIVKTSQDGNFGTGTEAATKQWQSDHWLTADGVVGPATWSAALNPQTVSVPVATVNFPDLTTPAAPSAPRIEPIAPPAVSPPSPASQFVSTAAQLLKNMQNMPPPAPAPTPVMAEAPPAVTAPRSGASGSSTPVAAAVSTPGAGPEVPVAAAMTHTVDEFPLWMKIAGAVGGVLALVGIVVAASPPSKKGSSVGA